MGTTPRAALQRAYQAALREHRSRRPDPQDFWGQGLDGRDAYEAALEGWATELVRLEAALRVLGRSAGGGNDSGRMGGRR